MKKRIGFVSNSSSSSFIAIGFNAANHISKLESLFNVSEVREYLEDTLDFNVLDSSEAGVNDGDFVISYFISYGDDDLESNVIPLSDLNKKYKKLYLLKNKIDNDLQMNLYTGTMLC